MTQKIYENDFKENYIKFENVNMILEFREKYGKYPLRWYILGACNCVVIYIPWCMQICFSLPHGPSGLTGPLELSPCGFKIKYTLLSFASLSSGLTGLLELWSCGFKIEYTHLGFASAGAVQLVCEVDPGCIFFTLNTYQATFISDILWYDCRNWC